MSSRRNHIVRRQVLSVEVATQSLGHACLHGLRGTLQPMLQACLERVLADYDPDDGQTLDLGRLELDLGTLRLGSLADALPVAIESELRKLLVLAQRDAKLPAALQGAAGAGPLAETPTLAVRTLDAWMHFFKAGSWPWWHTPQAEPAPALAVMLAAFSAAGLADDLQACLRMAHWIGMDRLALVWEHFGLDGIFPALDQFWRGGMLAIAPAAHGWLLPALVLRRALLGPGMGHTLEQAVALEVLVGCQAASQAVQVTPALKVWAKSYAIWRSGSPASLDPHEQRWIQLLDSLAAALPEIAWPDAAALQACRTWPPAVRQAARVAPQEEVPFYIDNAGLVLLHPFLQPLLEGLGLVEGPDFVDAGAAGYAALLLHYLVHEDAPSDESALVLNKVLCGLDPGHFIDIAQPIDLAHRVELDEVLAAVCAHWKELRQAGKHDLQQSFLRRSGKLHLGSPMALTVDRQTIDLIVDRLPWAISLVRLPWMGGMLEVRW